MIIKGCVLFLYAGLGLCPLIAQTGVGDDPDSVVAMPPAGFGRLYEAPTLSFFSGTGSEKGNGVPLGTMNTSHVFSSDFDSIDGSVSSFDFTFFAPFASIRVGDGYVIPMINYRYNKFDTDGATLLPEDSLHLFRMPIAFLCEPANRWIAGGMVMPSFGGDLSNSDNFSFAAAVGAGYAYSPNLKIFGGVYYSRVFEESFLVGGPGFIWNNKDKWQAYLLGPRASVSYRVSDDWTLSLMGRYNAPAWNVQSDELGPERNIRMRELRLGLKTENRIGKNLWAFAEVGYALFREMEIEDIDGNELQFDDVDASVYVQAGLTLRF